MTRKRDCVQNNAFLALLIGLVFLTAYHSLLKEQSSFVQRNSVLLEEQLKEILIFSLIDCICSFQRRSHLSF